MRLFEPLRQGARSAILRRARDHTDAAERRSALVITPHPDDETLGCGATMARKQAAGCRVTVLALTDGRHSHRSRALTPEALGTMRRAELAEAARRLGLPDRAVRWADLPDGGLAGQEDQLVELIGSMLSELRPDEVYVTCADEPHPDHAAAGRAARRATAGAPVALWEYPVWLWGAWPLRRHDRVRSTASAARLAWRRGAVVVDARAHLPAKRSALSAYESQLGRPAGVPADEAWSGLPPRVLAAAAEPVELFLPVPPAARA